MARTSLERDYRIAEQGYIKTSHVAYLIGARRFVVLAWPVPHIEISGGNYYKWDAVLTKVGADQILGFGLPPTAIEALDKVVASKNKAKPILNKPTETALDGAVTVTKPKKKRVPKAKAALEVLPDPHLTEPDVQDAVYPQAPSAHPLSKYLGNTIKLTADKLAELPEYTLRVPSSATIGTRKWKANRASTTLTGEPDWWQGEYIFQGDEDAIRWSKILLFIDHKKNSAPPASMTENEIKDTVTNDVALVAEYGTIAPPVLAAPEPLPVITRPVLRICKRCTHDVSFHNANGCIHPDCVASATRCTNTPPAQVAA